MKRKQDGGKGTHLAIALHAGQAVNKGSKGQDGEERELHFSGWLVLVEFSWEAVGRCVW